MEVKKDILLRVYLVFAFLCLFGLAILVQVCRLQFVQGAYWKSKADSLTTGYKNIEAARGNIYAADGSLLATSLPIFEIRMDLMAGAITTEIFNKNIDSLSICLSEMFQDKKPKDYRRELVLARREQDRYHLIGKNVSYTQLKLMRKFPLFRLGKYKGGLMALQRNVREHPFKMLASRTIGYDMSTKAVGIEGSFREYLQGVSGKRLMQKISGNVWMPINSDNEIEPKDGYDLVTTIDVNIQDVAEQALLTQLTQHNADHGCAVLMEVETGEIRAIANLSRNIKGEYNENYNYAIGESMEPGSTFKLASLVAAMEDKLVQPGDTVDLENGALRFYNRIMKDSHAPERNRVSVQRAFEISSNVGISKIINKSYQRNPQAFVSHLWKMNLSNPLGLQISGEANPYIKGTKDKLWSGTSLPWMSIGYEVRLTPLQVLNFYNAIANDGKMVKPFFVKSIKQGGEIIKDFEPTVINAAVCSKETAAKARKMLEGVVENGTGSTLKNPNYKIAGKTGTAQVAKASGKYRDSSGVTYQASFVGYFPAENPKYSCIVVVNAPSNDVYYAAQVAGPIFKEIADKVYSTSLNIHKPLDKEFTEPTDAIAASNTGNQKDFITLYQTLGQKPVVNNETCVWAYPQRNNGNVTLTEAKIEDDIIPSVIGMGLKDALYILENAGLHVKVSGKGYVSSQSILPGTKIIKGTEILLQLI